MDHSVAFLRRSLATVKAELARLEALVECMPRRKACNYDRRIEFARWHVQYLKERIEKTRTAKTTNKKSE
jgi:hypothetical protein